MRLTFIAIPPRAPPPPCGNSEQLEREAEEARLSLFPLGETGERVRLGVAFRCFENVELSLEEGLGVHSH